MRETERFAQTFILRVRLLLRLAFMVIVLTGTLTASRTIFAANDRDSADRHSYNKPDLRLVVVHIPLFLAFWITANSVFRAERRRTLVQEATADEGSLVILVIMFTAPVACVSSYLLFAHGQVMEDRLRIAAISSTVASIPFVAWITLANGVIEAFRKEQDELRKRQREQDKKFGPSYALRMRILRRDYETKIHDISRMRIGEEERLYLRELVDTEYRDRVRQIMSGSDQFGNGGSSDSIESLLQDNEDN